MNAIKNLPVGLTADQISALEKAEARRAEVAAEAARKAAEECLSPREIAAREVEALGFEGLDDVAAALRGELFPAKLGAETLISALRDRRIPSELKNDGGPIRTAIASAWANHNAEQNARRDELVSQSARAETEFKEFCEELQELSRRMPGYATDQLIRATSARFFRHEDGLPPLVKVMEDLIITKESNEINVVLRRNPQLASTVASAADGHRASALINAMQAQATEAVHANFRRKVGGKFGRQDGQTPASHEARDAGRQARRDERNARRPVGKKGK